MHKSAIAGWTLVVVANASCLSVDTVEGTTGGVGEALTCGQVLSGSLGPDLFQGVAPAEYSLRPASAGNVDLKLAAQFGHPFVATLTVRDGRGETRNVCPGRENTNASSALIICSFFAEPGQTYRAAITVTRSAGFNHAVSTPMPGNFQILANCAATTAQPEPPNVEDEAVAPPDCDCDYAQEDGSDCCTAGCDCDLDCPDCEGPACREEQPQCGDGQAPGPADPEGDGGGGDECTDCAVAADGCTYCPDEYCQPVLSWCPGDGGGDDGDGGGDDCAGCEIDDYGCETCWGEDCEINYESEECFFE